MEQLDSQTLKRRRTFALRCKEIRLFIAQNPGVHYLQIKEKFNICPLRHLDKMSAMGIIKRGDAFGDSSYFVVPQ